MLCDAPRADPVRFSLAHGQYLRVLIETFHSLNSKTPAATSGRGFQLLRRGDTVRRTETGQRNYSITVMATLQKP
jgi:hypothetical protein